MLVKIPGAKIFTLEDGVVLTFMLSYILYRIIFSAKKYSTGFSRERMTPKNYKKILRGVWLALLDFQKTIQK